MSAIVLEDGGGIAGFGLLKPFLPFPVFRKTGMLTYFLAPQAVRKGFGSRLLEQLAKRCEEEGDDHAGCQHVKRKTKRASASTRSMGFQRPETLQVSVKNSGNLSAYSGCRERWSEAVT
jgi:L-amino acid N-acyltransferase YncA